MCKERKSPREQSERPAGQSEATKDYKESNVGFSILFFVLAALYSGAFAVYCILGGSTPGAVTIFLNIIVVAVQGGYFWGLAHDPN